MTSDPELAFRAIDHSLLCCASLLVPGSRRSEWRREWQAELWHARQSCAEPGTISWKRERYFAAFCLGAFQDAAVLRQDSWRNREWSSPFQGSAPRCLLLLAGVLAVSYLIALLLPGVRATNDPSRYHVRPGLILIQDARHNDDLTATIGFKQLQNWKRNNQRYFDGLAFYRISREPVSTAAHVHGQWQVAQASSNLFALLGLPVQFMTPDRRSTGDLPQLVLSNKTWQREFSADSDIIGSVISIGGRQARVAAIAPDGCWRLPGSADAWLLEQDSEITSSGNGYVVAHLTPLGQSEMWSGRVHITSYDEDSSEHSFWGLSLDERTRGPWSVYQFAVFLAFLALPAITSVSLGEYNFSGHRPLRIQRLIRFLFLSSKIVLLLLIAYFSSLDLAYWYQAPYSATSVYIQLISSFLICLFGMRWVLLDHRQRCPVCLNRVAHPAQVGHTSRMFLAWSGTELICTEGHTLLYVPDLATSWFSAPRWMYLDSSWDFLFAN